MPRFIAIGAPPPRLNVRALLRGSEGVSDVAREKVGEGAHVWLVLELFADDQPQLVPQLRRCWEATDEIGLGVAYDRRQRADS